MLSQEENSLLTQVQAGSPMGAVFRRYWIPALLTEEMPIPTAPGARATAGRGFGRSRQRRQDRPAMNTAPIAALHSSSGATRHTVCAASTMAGSMTSRPCAGDPSGAGR
jgi:hypothetical protein